MISKLVAIALGTTAAAAVVAYCVYFDHKRRKQPDYKKKVLEKRAKDTTKQEKKSNQVPKFASPQEAQAFFIHEVELSEELMTRGVLEEAMDHLANAITIYGTPDQLMQVFSHTLPPHVFSILSEKVADRKPASCLGFNMPFVIQPQFT